MSLKIDEYICEAVYYAMDIVRDFIKYMLRRSSHLVIECIASMLKVKHNKNKYVKYLRVEKK